jgi:hypothetical protein
MYVCMHEQVCIYYSYVCIYKYVYNVVGGWVFVFLIACTPESFTSLNAICNPSTPYVPILVHYFLCVPLW